MKVCSLQPMILKFHPDYFKIKPLTIFSKNKDIFIVTNRPKKIRWRTILKAKRRRK